MNFENVKSKEELLRFMDENIKYGYIDKDGNINNNSLNFDNVIVQCGESILSSKVGTCWDQVELERLWFEKNNYEFKTIFIYFESNKENDFPTHTFLIFKENDKWYWFEHAFEKYKGIHEFSSYLDAINYVMIKHLEYAVSINKASLTDKNILKAYEYFKPQKDYSLNEYLDFIFNNGVKIDI